MAGVSVHRHCTENVPENFHLGFPKKNVSKKKSLILNTKKLISIVFVVENGSRMWACGARHCPHINNENQVIYFISKRLVNVLSDVLFY